MTDRPDVLYQVSLILSTLIVDLVWTVAFGYAIIHAGYGPVTLGDSTLLMCVFLIPSMFMADRWIVQPLIAIRFESLELDENRIVAMEALINPCCPFCGRKNPSWSYDDYTKTYRCKYCGGIRHE